MEGHEVAAWFAGKTFEELGAIEHSGHLLFPDALRKRGPKGEEVRVEVMVRVPTDLDRSLARIDALEFVRDQAKSARNIETVDQARAAVGPEVFENLDTTAIVARCTFERKPPHQQFLLLPLLLASWPRSSVYDLFDRIDYLSDLIDPRMGELTEEQIWLAVGAIAKVRNISPLGAMRGPLQSSFIVRMADLLWNSAMRPSSSPSKGRSTRAA